MFDPSAPSLIVDPYPAFRYMREHEPVHFSQAMGSWMLFAHRDVFAFHHDRSLRHAYEQGQRVLRGDGVIDELYFRVFRLMLFVLDDPAHERVRALFAKSFTARQIRNLEPTVREIAHALVDNVAQRGAMDLVADYANPLPVRVIGDLIGVPEADQVWVAEKTATLNQVLGFLPLAPDVAAAANCAIGELCDYIGDLATSKRANPGDDLLTQMVVALDERDDLTFDELLANTILLYLAGHETTSGSLALAMLSLHRNPDQLEILRRNHALIPGAVEEILRYDASGQATFRVTTQPTTFGDVEIPLGQGVLAWIGAANRDPDRYPEPDRLDVNRRLQQPIGFGGGAHYCLGNAVARQELAVGLEVLLRRLPGLRLDTLEPDYRPSTFTRGVVALPVRW
jgi:cytochrome P450